MTDEEILAMQDHELPRGRITVHEIAGGKVYFVSRLHGSKVWFPWSMRRELFEDAVAREIIRPRQWRR
jgi:hypothetical protein